MARRGLCRLLPRRGTADRNGRTCSSPVTCSRRRAATRACRWIWYPSAMIRTKILGLGSYVPERVVTNEEIPFLDHRHVRLDTKQTETDDAWIQQRTGIKERRYVPNDGSTWTSDLALHAARAALGDAGLEAKDIDCIIFGTLSPDFHFPGTGVMLQKKLGIAETTSCACFDIRQQCSAFVY